MRKLSSRSLPVFLTLAVLALSAAYYSGLLSVLTGRDQSFTKSVEKGSYFFRVKIDLTYKDEPILFDVVVACGVTITNYRDGDRSFGATMTPELFMQRISDNHGVMLKVPRFCWGQTTGNGKVPEDILPGILWFEDADNWLEAIGYFTELAYENPRAQLKFQGASVQAVSRAAWEEWRKTEEPKNLVPAYMPPNKGIAREIVEERQRTWTMQRLYHDWLGPVRLCYGAQRFKMTEDMREIVSSYWPDNQPRYWAPSEDIRLEIAERFRMIGPDYYPGKGQVWQRGPLLNEVPFFNYVWKQEGIWNATGNPTRAGGGMSEISHAKYPAPEMFPMRRSNWVRANALKTSAAQSQGDIIKNFEVGDGEMNGFLYCFTQYYGTQEQAKKARCTVDGDPIQMERRCWSAPNWFFEHEEYLFQTVRY